MTPSATAPLTAGTWPRPADPRRAADRLSAWLARAGELGDPALADRSAGLAADPAGRAMLDAIFGNSPFLAHCLMQELPFLPRLTGQPLDTVFAGLLADLDAAGGAEADLARLGAVLRRARRRVALTVALADIGGLWSVEQVTGALTAFAEHALANAVRQLLRQLASKGEMRLDLADPSLRSGLIVLGLGKLGAGELNYSSDVDLIVLYDEARVQTSRTEQISRNFIRLTRQLVQLLEERTADGYVFRTDLRLRPDPAATPLAVSVVAAETYYGSLAQGWERAAMIKARPVAGDLEAGAQFLKAIQPFIWRRSLDFAAIEEIHAVRRRMLNARGHARIAVAGHDVKIGRGGIRDIEFFVQTHQLIYGGRNTKLRVTGTCNGLAVLAEAGHISPETATELADGYRFLRRVEHRLQMVEDHQTHALPAEPAAIEAFSQFMGFADGRAFETRMRQTLECVERHYADLFEDTGLPPGPDLVFTGADDDPATLAALGQMGFSQPATVASVVRGWLHGRYRATRSERAQILLRQLLAGILSALAATPNPDTALTRFDEFLARLPAGVQLFSLFASNPFLLGLVAEIMGTSPRLAGHLARYPDQLDLVLSPDFFGPLPGRDQLAPSLYAALAPAETYEDALNATRRWTNDHRFRVGVQILRNQVGGAEAGRFLAEVAELGLAALGPRVERELAARHGRFGATGPALLAMGKLGGGEMTISSDLDLIIVYDVPEGVEQSDGSKPLPATLYFNRLIQRLVSAITAPTAEGPLYQVDMRLRPSGNAGPLATSLKAFEQYQRESAWTWEHMALTRARAIYGPPALADAIGRIVRDTLTRPRDGARLLADVADMRRRIAQQHGRPVWDIKHRRGGLIDIEFIAQYLQLRAAPADPQVLSPTTATALERLGQAGHLDPGIAGELLTALRLWQQVQGFLRTAQEGSFDPAQAPPALLQGVGRALGLAGTADAERLTEAVEQAGERAFAHYVALIEAPAGTAAT